MRYRVISTHYDSTFTTDGFLDAARLITLHRDRDASGPPDGHW